MSCFPCASCSSITDLATTIWNDLGQPSGQPVSYIQSKLVSQPYVGKLNNLISTCYAAVTGTICPALGEQEQGIYQSMYEMDYYTTKLNQTLAGLSPGVIELADGDSKIRFVNPVEQAKVYTTQQRMLNEQLFWQVSAYRGMAAQPSAVDMYTILNVPGGDGYGGNGSPAAGGPHNYYRS